MARILADLPEEDIEWLDRAAEEQGKSRAAVLRDAVSVYKAQSPACGRKEWIARGAGYWKHRTDIGDAVQYQQAMREDRTSYEEI